MTATLTIGSDFLFLPLALSAASAEVSLVVPELAPVTVFGLPVLWFFVLACLAALAGSVAGFQCAAWWERHKEYRARFVKGKTLVAALLACVALADSAWAKLLFCEQYSEEWGCIYEINGEYPQFDAQRVDLPFGAHFHYCDSAAPGTGANFYSVDLCSVSLGSALVPTLLIIFLGVFLIVWLRFGFRKAAGTVRDI